MSEIYKYTFRHLYDIYIKGEREICFQNATRWSTWKGAEVESPNAIYSSPQKDLNRRRKYSFYYIIQIDSNLKF